MGKKTNERSVDWFVFRVGLSANLLGVGVEGSLFGGRTYYTRTISQTIYPTNSQHLCSFQEPAGIFELIEVVGNGTYGQVYKVRGTVYVYSPLCYDIYKFIGWKTVCGASCGYFRGLLVSKF